MKKVTPSDDMRAVGVMPDALAPLSKATDTVTFNEDAVSVMSTTAELNMQRWDERRDSPRDERRFSRNAVVHATTLKEAVEENSASEVIRLLSLPENRGQINADVDFLMTSYRVPKEARGPVLIIAIVHGYTDMISLLLEHRADIERCWLTHSVGIAKVPFVSRPINASIIAGELENVKLLVAARARLEDRCRLDDKDTGATTIWQAANHGNLKVMSFLLAQKSALIHLDTLVTSQDDINLMHAPLHIAVRICNLAMVTLLIEAGANIHQRSSDLRHAEEAMPLTHAINLSHEDIVKLLVSKSADLFLEESVRTLFKKNDLCVIASAAEGLQVEADNFEQTFLNMPDSNSARTATIERMPQKALVQFLRTPGRAPEHIMKALFRTQELKYWEVQQDQWHGRGTSQSKQTQQKRTTGAFKDTSIHACLGPSSNVLMEKFHSKTALHGRDLEFIYKLAPVAEDVGTLAYAMGFTPSRTVPIEVQQCLLPGIHRDLEVRFALAEAPSDKVFGTPGCQAIVENGWKEMHLWKVWDSVANLMVVLLFLVNSLAMDHTSAQTLDMERPAKEICKSINVYVVPMLSLFWLRSVFIEIGQAFGCFWLGTLSSYISFDEFVDVAMITLMAFVLRTCVQHEFFGMDVVSKWDRILMAITVFSRWLKVLNSCRGFRIIGPRMLPILRALQDMYPFLAVVFCPLFGFVHAYQCLGIRTPSAAFIDIYRLAFFGDFDLDEMEEVNGEYEKVSEDRWQWVDPEPTPFFYIVRLVMMVAGFVLTITFMNIFIGVLSKSYEEADNSKEALFIASRANMLSDYTAMQATWKMLVNVLFFWRRRAHRTSHSADWDFLWFSSVRQENGEALSVEKELEELTKEGDTIAEKVDDVSREVIQLRTDVQIGLNKMNEAIRGLTDFKAKTMEESVQLKESLRQELQTGMAEMGANLSSLDGFIRGSVQNYRDRQRRPSELATLQERAGAS
mmetsp:Transcript_60495/g.129805  ORF Transcript_60495/g.129805 Transcript_60495/m.129805 type:complete len:967 (-) Transcript_60495:143-3043(-)